MFVEIDGCPTIKDIRADLLGVFSDRRFLTSVTVLVDFRGLSPSTSVEDLRALAADLHGAPDAPSDRRCAVLADADVVFGLLRMLEVFCDGTALKVRAFRERDDALDWLRSVPGGGVLQ